MITLLKRQQFPTVLFILMCLWLLPAAGRTQPLHSIMLSVPGHSEEALTWCGPATAQMIMAGYPTGACTVLQEDIWAEVLLHKTESLWDTDPMGMKGAFKTLCPPSGTWVVYHKTDPAELMFRVAYWMTRNSFPVAIVKDTVSHNSYAAHSEHWVVIRGIITDTDPTTSTSVNLVNVWFNDPSPSELGGDPIIRFVTGTQWYAEFAPVTKVGSTYHGQYVAVIEPPQISGLAVAKTKVWYGTLISPQDALAYAARWVKEKKLYEIESYKILAGAKPLKPLLVNKEYAGYYIIPYSEDGRLAQTAVIVNAYTGAFEEVGAFKPIEYLSQEQAVNIALEELKTSSSSRIDKANPQPEPSQKAKLVHPQGEHAVSRYFPIWQVKINGQTVGVGQQKQVYTRMPRLHPAIPATATRPQSLAWDQQHLWLFDAHSGELKSVDSRSGAVVKSLHPKVKNLAASTFGGGNLWLADQGAMKLIALDPNTGRVRKALPLKYPKDKGFDRVTGMAWDGEHLWIAVAAGFSSSINQIDTSNGEIMRSIFAECDPRGIAIADNTLYTICYNGENLPAKIDRRNIVGKNQEILKSREFIIDLDLKAPSALVHDGENLWVLDQRLNTIVKIHSATPKKK